MSADSMNSVFGFIGILAVGCGIYCLYAYFNMKKDGHINETILLGKSYSEKMCKDKEAYLKKALPAVLGFGIVSILYGIVDCIHWYVNPMEMVDTVGGILFMAALVVFAVYTMQLKKKYFSKDTRGISTKESQEDLTLFLRHTNCRNDSSIGVITF